MKREVTSIADLPNVPAVYAMFGGRGRSKHIAYVGVAGKLKNRIKQHLVRRDSSVVAGNAAARLDPENVTEVLWWEDTAFEDRVALEAAENVAFEVLNPVLISRGTPQLEVKELAADAEFAFRMRDLFDGEASGSFRVISFEDALERIEDLESRVEVLERRIGELGGN